jgi:uncharacterized protein YutE (UPF0331/DUF86 family)
MARLRELGAMSLDEFRAMPDGYAVAEHHLRRALQALLDLGRHLAVRSNWGNPSNYREVFDLLEQGGVLAPLTAERGRSLAGYRNRLVHEYAAVSGDELWEILQTRLSDVAGLLQKMLDHVGGGKEPGSA